MRPLFLEQQTHPPGPTHINFTGTSVPVNIAAGDFVGSLSSVGGVSPFTYTCSNSKFQISGSDVLRSATGTLTQGVSESLNFTSTDANSESTNTANNGQGPFTVTIAASNVPTGVNTSPDPISIPATTGGNVVIATLTEVGGTGVSVVFSVTGNANLTVSGANLMTVASPSFTAGVNQTYSLHVTDTGGTFDDPSPRTLTVQAASGPTAITQNPSTLTILANTGGNVNEATLGAIGGTAPYVFTFAVSDANLAISGSTLKTAASPTFTPGTTPTYTLRVTDANSNVFTDNARTYSVPAGPTGITHTPDSILDNATADTIASTLTPIVGTSPGTWAITTGLTAFNIGASGSTSTLTLKSAAVGTLTPGQTTAANQGTVTYTDAAGLSTSPVTINLTVQDHTASVLIANITAVNTSTTTDTAVNATTISFGHPVKDGQLTGYPIFKMNDGTVIPYSIGQQCAWNSGSNKFATYLLRLPQAIAHNVSGTGQNVLGMYSNGTAPTASALSYSDITANTDFKIVGTILSSVGTDTGTWTCSLNDCITEAVGNLNNATIETYANGQAGIWYVIEGNFKQSGSVHGQLRGRWEVQVLPTVGQTLAGFRVRCTICQPFWDVDTPTKGFRSFSALKFQSGSTVIRDMANAWASGGNPFTFSATVGSSALTMTSGTDAVYGANNGGYFCRLTTTGTLPSPFQTGTDYYVNKTGSGSQFGLKSTYSIGGSGFISATSIGSGQHTVTIYPALTSFNGISTAAENAMFDCFDSTGTAIADTTVRFKMDTAYWISTKCLLPYRVPAASRSNQANLSKYVVNGSGGKTPNGMFQPVGSTGDISDLGPLPLQYTYHLFTQAAVDEETVRCNGLSSIAFAKYLRTSVDGRIPAVNNGTNGGGGAYTGMSGPFPTMRFGQSVNFPNGAQAPSGVLLMTFGEQSNDHMPNWGYYPYLFTGESAYRDTVIAEAAGAIINLVSSATSDTDSKFGILVNGSTIGPNLRRVNIPGGSNYYGLTVVNNVSTRAAAWGTRNVVYAAGILADGLIEKTYFTDVNNDNFQFLVDHKTLMATGFPFADSIGILPTTRNADAGETGFQNGYRTWSILNAATLTENTNALTVLNQVTKFFKWINDNMDGALMTSAYEYVYRQAAGGMAASISGITLSPLKVTTTFVSGLNVNDYVIVDNVVGTTQINGNTYVISALAGNTMTLVNTDGSVVNTTGWGSYISGGVIGGQFITSLSQWGGATSVSCSWTANNATFTQVDNGMAQHNWVNYVFNNGDGVVFPDVSGSSSLTPAGLQRGLPYYVINYSAGTFNLTTVSGDAGHIVTPTNAGTSNCFIRPISTPKNVAWNSNNALTWQIVFGNMCAAKAAGATVDATLLTNMENIFTASQGAPVLASPNINSKYLMAQTY